MLKCTAPIGRRGRIALTLTVIAMSLLSATPAQLNAQLAQAPSAELERIDVVEHPGAMVPGALTFTNDLGQEVTLSGYMQTGRPIILVMAYYECPMLCTMVLNGLSAAAKNLPFTPGREYQILTVSINPRETWQLAAAKKKNYLQAFDVPGAADGWHFLTGPEQASRQLADAIGFNYFWDEDQEQYAHPAVVTILTPEGKISRYLYGIEFKTHDLRLALLEASAGRIGSTIDRLLLYCYHYDPEAKGYVVLATNIMKIAGLVTVILLALFLAILWLRDRTSSTAHSL